jgi:hypothetical protein
MTLLSILLFFIRCPISFVYCPPILKSWLRHCPAARASGTQAGGSEAFWATARIKMAAEVIMGHAMAFSWRPAASRRPRSSCSRVDFERGKHVVMYIISERTKSRE